MDKITKKKSGSREWLKKNRHLFEEKRIHAVKNSEKLKIAAKNNLGKNRKESMKKLMLNPKRQKGIHNTFAVKAIFRSPRNIIYHVTNVVNFVRENQDLFPPHTLNWSTYKNNSKYPSDMCSASKGLCRLIPYKRNGKAKLYINGSWYGWTYVSELEVQQNPSMHDLLDRKEIQ